MRYLNQAIVEGILTKDSDENGFKLAVEDDDNHVDFVAIRWGNFPHDSLRKGDAVRVIGRMRSEYWRDENGWKANFHISAEEIRRI